MASTLRLNDEEKQLLEVLKKHLGKGTNSGAIKAVIAEYMTLSNKLDQCKEELRESKRNHQELLESILDVQQAQSRLNEITSDQAR